MNCSQLLERRATTNWEKPAASLQKLEAHLNELRSESRPWGLLRPATQSPDRNFSQAPISPARLG
jgi:hypothetical protein